MALAFGSSWFVFVRVALVATFGLEAAQKLFAKMLRSVFRASMSFFDSTPAKQILNRVSVDQSVVDLDINNNTTSWHSWCNDKSNLASLAFSCLIGHCKLVDAGNVLFLHLVLFRFIDKIYSSVGFFATNKSINYGQQLVLMAISTWKQVP
ncbi:hypothetical protein NE237_028606 [Protea cynaroides]|uniref:ABC transmembrane type-1 domain-containing protein n=1 Tax=Protea cynaroides TaxID=273540 RepID=A0A9Q0GU52_9MAGN|nr:hypothetical protein NE237_028606 [Protea cynaroides]